MENVENNLFICFSAKDRYKTVQPIVYHLKNYGINIWYDRYKLVMGDNRIEKNIVDGASKCKYALIVLSQDTVNSICATEEIKILESRYYKNDVVIFPVLYELNPKDIPPVFCWVKDLIFKEVDRSSGTLEICNHIACKITQDMLKTSKFKTITDVINSNLPLPKAAKYLLQKYTYIDNANLNSRVSLLYATYTIIQAENLLETLPNCEIPIKVFERLFNETLLNLSIDYREMWLLENSLCVLIDYYVESCTESKM